MKKICDRGLNWFQIYDYKGNVRQCSWTKDGNIGNLYDNTVEEVYHSDKAKKIRSHLINKDYSICNIDACPYLAMNEVEKHLIEYENTPKYPTEIYLGYERVCNYACRSCTIHQCMIEEKKYDLENYYNKIEERLKPILPYVKKISANGCGEIFCSKHILKILKNWRPLSNKDEIEVLIESNGSLFDAEHWKEIDNLGQYNLKVAITVMSFDEKTYQYLSGTRLPISQVENNLKFIKRLREKQIINYFEIATVVQERNFREMPQFVDKCLREYNPDYIRLRPYESWGAQSPEEAWITDIRNPEHPYYQEYKEVMKNPVLKNKKVYDWSGGLDTVNPVAISYKYDYFKMHIISEIYDNINCILKNLNENLGQNKNDLVIYGISIIGEILVDKLEANGFNIPYIIDKNKNGQKYKGIDIISLDEIDNDLKRYSVIVKQNEKRQSIKDDLKELGFDNVVFIGDLMESIEIKKQLQII